MQVQRKLDLYILQNNEVLRSKSNLTSPIRPPQHSAIRNTIQNLLSKHPSLQMSDSPPVSEIRAAMDPFLNGLIVEAFLYGT